MPDAIDSTRHDDVPIARFFATHRGHVVGAVTVYARTEADGYTTYHLTATPNVPLAEWASEAWMSRSGALSAAGDAAQAVSN
jgi:hypothetical protein